MTTHYASLAVAKDQPSDVRCHYALATRSATPRKTIDPTRITCRRCLHILGTRVSWLKRSAKLQKRRA